MKHFESEMSEKLKFTFWEVYYRGALKNSYRLHANIGRYIAFNQLK